MPLCLHCISVIYARQTLSLHVESLGCCLGCCYLESIFSFRCRHAYSDCPRYLHFHAVNTKLANIVILLLCFLFLMHSPACPR